LISFEIPIYMTTIECPTCQSPILSDDRFCEACGSPLGETPPPKQAQAGCQKCSAPIDSIDSDGYCDRCGFRNRPVDPEFDRIAVTLSNSFAGMSDRGLRHHQNEDYFTIHEQAQGQILIVCDGVSSSTAPQTASQTAAKIASRALSQSLEQAPINTESLQAAIQQAQQAVAGLTDATSADPPSTTIVAAVVQEGVASIGWLGDSRAYWISSEGSQVLTADHSWFNEQVSGGQLSAAEAHQDPRAHAITRWLGADAEMEPAQTLRFTMPGEGYLVLCSDGLWNYLSDADHLATLITMDLESSSIAQRLIDYANSKGGKDNITVALLIVN
jgi:PPM family protein phosphatase